MKSDIVKIEQPWSPTAIHPEVKEVKRTLVATHTDGQEILLATENTFYTASDIFKTTLSNISLKRDDVQRLYRLFAEYLSNSPVTPE